jgi:diguanylate cyclase (GGDEF)-like protein
VPSSFTKYCRHPLLALILILFSLSSHALDKVVLQLKWKHQFQFAGFYAAQTQGYFAEEGLEVDIREVDYNRSPLDIVMSGDAQFGISDSTLVLARLQGKKPVGLAAIFQHSPLVLLSLESSGIVSPLELKDKRVMYLRGTDDAVIRAMFTELGLSPIDYTHVPHTFNDQDLVTGKVDAVSGYITDQPFYFRQKGININVISPANYGIDFYGDMIFVEENYFRQNKNQALAFRRAAIRGWQYAIENQEEMVDWIRANLAPDKSKENLMYEAETTSRIIKSDIIDLGYFSTNRLIRIADIYKGLNLVHRDSDFSGINYEDHLGDSVYQRQWIKITVVSIAIISFLALILTLANFRLKAKVREKTEKLLSATHTMRRYLKVIDQYVISCMMSPDLRILDASKAMAKAVESQVDALKDKQLSELLHDQYDPTLNAISSSLKSQQSWIGELQMHSVAGKELWFEVFIEPENSDPQYQNEITLIATDISDRKRIEQLSLTDSLTGLANRRHLDSVLENEFRRMQRHKTSLSLLMYDVDFFKQFNDVYGHQQGDRCLQQISQVCKQLEQRPADLAVRYGGEEFILLLPETDSSGAKKIAHQLLENIAELDIRHKASSVAEYVTISIGVATVEKDTIRRVEDIIDLADKQLYKAKSAGRNCISSHHLSPDQ